jgi:hypothetical protein
MKVAATLALSVAAINALAQPAHLPRFEDYPVKDIFTGSPAQPILTTPKQREYRTRIRQGVTKGWGVKDGATGTELGKPGPNFAGHYALITWGCGAPCLMAAIVDLQSGTVFYPPITGFGIGKPNFALPMLTPEFAVSRNPSLEYRVDSSLLIIKATPWQTEKHPSYAYYFLMEGNQWRLLRQVQYRGH